MPVLESSSKAHNCPRENLVKSLEKRRPQRLKKMIADPADCARAVASGEYMQHAPTVSGACVPPASLARMARPPRNNTAPSNPWPFNQKFLEHLACAIGLAFGSAYAFAAPVFERISASDSGLITHAVKFGNGNGLAAADFDSDGDIDLFLPGDIGTEHHLFENDGSGLFSDTARVRGILDRSGGRTALWFDADGDARLDLLVADDCFRQNDCSDTMLRLYRQTESGTFIDATASAGLSEPAPRADQHRAGLAAADLNGDGFVDFVSGFWLGRFHLFMNQGDGAFKEYTLASGIDSTERGYWQPILQDFNGDGLIDIYVTVDFDSNVMWLNQGTGPDGIPLFVDASAESNSDNNMNDMGVAAGDFDDDGDADIYASNIFFPGDRHNVLFRNESIDDDPWFTEISRPTGTENGAWGWGVTFLDVANDGKLDIAATNGWRMPGWENPIRLFIRQDGGGELFLDMAEAAGLKDTYWGSTLLAADIDRDGRLDLVQSLPLGDRNRNDPGAIAWYRNRTNGSPAYMVIKPRMKGPNHWAIGAKVTVKTASSSMTRWITAGTSFFGQEPAEAFFGLGSHDSVESITIDWPGGGQSKTGPMSAGTVIQIDAEGPFRIETD